MPENRPETGSAEWADSPTVGKFLQFFFSAYPGRSVVIVGLLAAAGFTEGVGVLTLLPMLEVVDQGGAPPTEGVGKYMVDFMAGIGVQPNLVNLLIALFLIVTVRSLLTWVAMRETGFNMADVARDIRTRFLTALLKARWRFFGLRPSGTFAQAIISEANSAAAGYREACEILAAVFAIIAYVMIASLISWQTSLFGLLSGLGLVWVLRVFVRISKEAAVKRWTTAQSLSGRIVDTMQGLKPIKAMGKEDLIKPILQGEVDGLNQAQRMAIKAAQNLKVFQEPAVTALLAVAVYALSVWVGLPMSALVVLVVIFYRLMRHINTLQVRYQALLEGETAFWSIFQKTAAAETAQEELHGGVPFSKVQKEIRFTSVRFSYDRGAVFDDLSIEIPAGTFVAIQGESGAGKTTFVDLIVGLHSPESGTIEVDGVNLQKVDLKAWRSEIGYVPQEMLLLNDDIRKNVTLGDPGVSEEDVEWALDLAGARGFIDSLPEGAQTRVGESGTLLSGGQRQRIAIARALVTRPSLLILDEVTTALDPETEAALCDTFEGLKGSMTILSISHQPALREVADEVYQLRNGQLLPAVPTPR